MEVSWNIHWKSWKYPQNLETLRTVFSKLALEINFLQDSGVLHMSLSHAWGIPQSSNSCPKKTRMSSSYLAGKSRPESSKRPKIPSVHPIAPDFLEMSRKRQSMGIDLTILLSISGCIWKNKSKPPTRYF